MDIITMHLAFSHMRGSLLEDYEIFIFYLIYLASPMLARG